MNTKQKPHIVIIGAGFAGLETARGLANAPVRITLIDKNNHHLFQPLLYQVAIAGLLPSQIAQPVRTAETSGCKAHRMDCCNHAGLRGIQAVRSRHAMPGIQYPGGFQAGATAKATWRSCAEPGQPGQ